MSKKIKLAREWAHGTERIPADAMLGITWRDEDGVTIKTVGEFDNDGRRIANLKLSSYTEIGSAGAMHWYARIKASVRCVSGTRRFSGYLPGAPHRNIGDDIELDATRPIRAGERDAWGRRIGQRGEPTTGFMTKDEARKAAIKLFHARFGPGWVLIIPSMYDEPEVVAVRP